MEYDNEFWEAVDKLVAECEIIIDRPKGTAHPRFPDSVYKVDYGYLKGTSSMDGGGIDVWRGSDLNNAAHLVDAVIITVDLMKRDSEIKLLLGCTEEEKRLIYEGINDSVYMKGIMIRR
jgi:inorganic pyrophosphatase